MTMAPPPLSTPRRERVVTPSMPDRAPNEIASSMVSLLRHLRGSRLDRFHDARIGAAAAEMAVHVLANLRFGRIGNLGKQFRRLDGLAVVAIAAVHRLLVDERLRNRVQVWRLAQLPLLGVELGQTFQCRDGTVADIGDRGLA